MIQSGGTHGPRKDDALKRETRSEVQANRATRSEEWREPEPAGEDQPDATWALAGKQGSAPPAVDPEMIQLRSDVARHLDRTAFPADRGRLLETMAGHQAPQRLLDVVSGLPADARFTSLHDVLEALDLPIETRGADEAGG